MQKRTIGTVLIVVGAVGFVLMVVASGLFIWQTTQLRSNADDILIPMAGGLEDLDDELDTVDQLVTELLGVLSVETIVDLAGRVDELNLRIETIGGYIEVADRALAGLEAIPLLPIDIDDLRTELEGFDAGLATLNSQFGQVAGFILENQDVPEQIADGVTDAIGQLRTGIDAAQEQVADAGDAVDRWLVIGSVLTLVLLAWSIVGQVALILWGLHLRRVEKPSQSSTTASPA